jgi:hypothetical protein
LLTRQTLHNVPNIEINQSFNVHRIPHERAIDP